MKAKIYLDKGAKMPVRATENSVGYDLYAVRWCWKVCNVGPYLFNVVFDTGVHIAPEEGYWCEVCPNSRLVNVELFMPNSVGIIDPDYRGSIKVVLRGVNAPSEEVWKYMQDASNHKHPVAQLIFHRMIDCEFEKAKNLKDLGETERGEGGFGSTERKQK